MKIISYSLWGNNLKYCVGAIKNAQLALELFPEWICRFYIANDVPSSIIEKLSNFSNVEIVYTNKPGSWQDMFLRFQPACEEDVEIFISRDCDSRLSNREKIVLDLWEKSDKGFLLLGAHFWHSLPIMGGGWGMKRGALPEFKALMGEWQKGNAYQCDQDFLNKEIWPRIYKNYLLFHSHYHLMWGGRPWPEYPPDNIVFFGQVFDENDNTVKEHLDAYYSNPPK